MVSMLRVSVVLLGALLALWATGCATAKAAAKAQPGQASSAQDNLDPLGAAGTNLKEDQGDGGAAGYDPKDIKVPGAEHGIKKEAGAKQASGGKKGKKGKKAAVDPATMPVPFSEAIAEQMEGLPWGMTSRSVMAYFESQVRAAYAEPLKNAGGLVEEDRVRGNMLRDLSKLKKSFVEFKGQRTGFEGSLIENEFTHNNNESMMMWDAGKYVEYMFFFEGRFWKRLRAFRKDQINNLDFDAYVGTLQNRFGQGKEIMSADGQFVTFKWKNDDTYMAAEDRSGFYGVYCLVFTARASEDNIDKLRTNADRADGRPKEDVSGMVQSVTSGDLSDHNTSVIDSYTGSAQEAPGAPAVDESSSVMSGKKGKGKGKKDDKPAADTKKAEEEKKAEEAPNVDDLF